MHLQSQPITSGEPRKRFLGVLGVLLIVCAFWIGSKQQSAEPKFREMTAWQWFRYWNKTGNIDEFRLAVRTLNTNFVPVFLKALKRQEPLWGVEYNDLYILAPNFFKRWLPTPVSHQTEQLAAFSGIDELLDAAPDSLTMFKTDEDLFRKLLKASSEEVSNRSLAMFWRIETADPQDSTSGKEHLHHPEFLVRFRSALKYEAELKRQEISRAEICFPVLLECLTNKTLMDQNFGPNAPAYLETASRIYQRVTPRAQIGLPGKAENKLP